MILETESICWIVLDRLYNFGIKRFDHWLRCDKCGIIYKSDLMMNLNICKYCRDN